MTLREFSIKGGKSRSLKKIKAARKNAAKARAEKAKAQNAELRHGGPDAPK